MKHFGRAAAAVAPPLRPAYRLAPMRPWYCKPFKPDRDWLAKYPVPSAPRKSTIIHGVPPYRAEIPGTVAPFDVPRAEIERCIEEREAYELARMQGLVLEPPLSALM